MIRLEDCRQAGRIGKPHGHEGAVKFELLPGLETDLNIDEPVFLFLEGKPVPFFMTECNESAQPPILHFEEVHSIPEARKLQHAEVWVPKDSLITSDEFHPRELVGLMVVDEIAGPLGPITGYQSSGLQDLLVMHYQEQEILLPLQNEIILKVSQDGKELITRLPEGLLDFYLNNEFETEEEE